MSKDALRRRVEKAVMLAPSVPPCAFRLIVAAISCCDEAGVCGVPRGQFIGVVGGRSTLWRAEVALVARKDIEVIDVEQDGRVFQTYRVRL